MLRALHAILGSLAVAPSSAARSQIMQRANEAAGMIHMLAEHIGTKGGASNAKVLGALRELGQATPNAEQSLNELLGKVVEDIQDTVSSVIIAGHNQTQEEVARRIRDLDAATQNTVAQKTVANQADDAWFACVGDEKASRMSVEAAEAALEQAEFEVGEPCRQQEERRSFSAEPTFPVFEECDLSLQGNCDAQVENFDSEVNSIVESLKQNLATHQTSYAEAKERCDVANANVVTKKSALDAANAALSSQKELCSQKHETRSLGMCLFGSDLQGKCEKVAAYEDLLAEIDATGNEFSHSDRIGEWTTTEMTKCVLNKIIAGGPLGANVMTECETAVDYEGDVGVIDRQTSDFEDLTTVEMFTCSESNISFLGETWVGFTDATASTDYVKEPYHPEVDLSVGSPAFSFCGGAPGK